MLRSFSGGVIIGRNFTLRQRDLHQSGVALSKELGLAHVGLIDGERIEGKYSQPVNLASGKHAVIQNAKEFVLVPWQPQFEKLNGRTVSGNVNVRGVDWAWTTERRIGMSPT